MAKTSCVRITPDLRKKYCEIDNISENDLAIFLYDYLENPRTPENVAEDLDLDNESTIFRELYNYRFKLGNSRFLLSNPNTFKQANANWNRMKEYGMDDEGYLVLDNPEKRKLLDWLNQSDDFRGHYASYNDLNGNTIVKIEQPIYRGKFLSDAQMKVIYGIKAQTIEEIQELLKERKIIHRYMGKWYFSKPNDASTKYDDLVKEGLIDGSKVTLHPRINYTLVEFNVPRIVESDDIDDVVLPNIDTDKITADSEFLRNIIIKSLWSQQKKERDNLNEVRNTLNSFNAGEKVKASTVLSLFRQEDIPSEYIALANSLIPLFNKTNIEVEFVDNKTLPTISGRVTTEGTKVTEVLINVESPKIKRVPHITIIHELIHTLSVSALNFNDNLDNEVSGIMSVVKNFMAEHGVPETTKYVFNGEEKSFSFDVYGLTNTREFIAEAFSNSDFIELLKVIPIEKVNKTAWDKFIDAIKGALNDLFHINLGKKTSVYEALVPIMSDVIIKSAYLGKELTENNNIDASYWEKPLDVNQLTIATKIARELLSSIYPTTKGENYQKVIEGFSGYFEGGGANIKDEYPNLSDEIINKLEAHLWGQGDFNEDDAIGFLNEASNTDSKVTYIMHSGGADGSDSYWGEVGARYGVKSNHYFHGRKTPKGNVLITNEQFERGKQAVLRANKTLNRKPERYMDLLARNYTQVENSDVIFAIEHLKNGIVDGGTGWAVQMAIDDGKPVYLFDQERNKWYSNINGKWSTSDTPTLTPNFAGIGTRELNDNGRRAIEEVYAKTFGSSQQSVSQQNVDVNPFEEADRIYDKLRRHFAERVAYSQNFKEDHVYLCKDSNDNWVKVDKSVSQLTEKGFDASNPWKEVSTGLGDTNDVFMRDFFANQLKPLDSNGNSPYPNLTGGQYKTLLKGAREVVKHLNSLFGKGNYKVSSQEFPILGYITEDGKTKTVAGTMDLLIYTKEGDFYIIDMKTKRVNQDGSIDMSRAIEGYSKQQYMYKNILEAAIPELRGRIKTPMLLVSSVSYPSPRDGYVYSKNNKGNVMVTYINTNGVKVTKPIQMIPNYSAPQYAKFITVEDFDVEIKELLAEFPEMTKEEFETEFGNLEIIKKSITERRQITLNTEQSKEAAETEALYSIIPKEEVAFLGHDIAITFTKIVDELLSDPIANEEYFTDENGVNPYVSYDLTKMSREDILNLPFMVDNILNIIKELEYNPESDSNIDLDDGAKSKISVAYNNFDALVKNSYAEFIKLEGLTFNENVSTDNYIPDGVDGSIQNTEDSAENEENEREHWQIGIRNMSAMSGLSARLRRFLSTLEDIDANGYAKADRFGYNRPVTLNGHEVVNSLLSWLKNCNTLEEMEDILKNLQINHPWIQSVLDGIKEEPIRSQFFQCFRKDFTEYSTIITVKRESEDGRTRWETVNRIINTTGAVDKVINEVRDAFFMKDISIFKDGLFNVPKIKSIADNIKSLKNKLKNQTAWNTIKRNPNSPEINEVKNILNSLGIMFDSVILADLVASDADVVSFIGSKLNKILTETAYITDNLLSGIEQKTYDPFSRDGKNSIYGNYRNIASIAEDYVVDALEASTYANGKMYYSFVSPSYIGQLLNNLTTTDSERVEKYLEENYGKYEWFKNSNTGKWNIKWLEDIASQDRQQIQRKVQLSYEGTDYVDLGERSYMLSLLKEFFYDQKNKTYSWYRVPTLSNKPSSEFIRNKRYSGNFTKELTNQLYNIFIQEIKRAQTVVERAISETITSDDKIKNYDIKVNDDIKKVLNKIKNGERVTLDDVVINGKYIFENSGASFKFLDDFVIEIVYKSQTGQYIVDKIFNKNLNVANDAQNISSITSLIGAFMENKVQRTYDYFEELGLIGKDLQFMSPILRIDDKTPKDKIKEALMPAIREYIWNDFVATANIVQLTATDLAFYKDSVDFQKRYAQIHSPGLRLNKSATNTINGRKTKVSDGKLRTLLIKDKISKSNIKENVRVALTNHLNSINDSVAKKEFKMMLDLIVNSFDSINEADAQAYTSPTGYMKKMVMSGEWNSAMQEAYEKIRSGNYDINDLGVVWQPLKPFVYTHTSMNGHSSTSKYIKVNSQHKNSEYLLIIADALTRGDKQNNILNTIMDFMESTHYDKSGNYKQDGIDTIEFNSAIKVGEHGVIDLNDLTAKEVKVKLNEAYTNEANVIAFPVEDYAIQQNVPAHFKEHSQPMGSQIRALVLSDLTGAAYRPLGKNVEYTPEEINVIYQDLIGRNVKRSWDKLAEDLKLDGTRLERNKKLSELLLEEMSKDARYGADLKRAVMLNAEGEFIIPLDDPIHSSRIQQLVNSIVKSRINKQRTKGGPVVQASSFGLSEDLNIIFCDSKGKELDTITKFGKRMGLSGKTLENKYREYLEKNQATVKHFECYVPLPSGLFEELLIQDGKVISIEEATNPNSPFYVDGLKNCLNAIGFRIPTEDTYSMVPIKIKGFVPKAAGEVVMLPKEITLLSGSDFDKYHC